MAPPSSRRSILDALPAHVAVLDRAGTVVEVNHAWRRFGEENGLRMSGHGIGSNYLSICDTARGAYAAGSVATAQGIREVLAGERDQFELEYPCHGPGVQRWFRLHVGALRDGEEAGVVISHRNVSSYQARALHLRADRMDALRRCARGAAHRYNDILTAVLGFGSLLREEGTEGHPSPHAYLDPMLRAAREGAELGAQLLAYCGQSLNRPAMVDPNTAATGAFERHRAELPEEVELRLALTPRPVRVWADESQLQRILDELVANAVDALQGKGVITIATGEESIDYRAWERFPSVPPGDYVVLSVHDTGAGVPAEFLPHLFEPFFTSQAVGGGAGLGLAVVRGLVEQNGGYIVPETETGVGTRFQVLFPMNPLPGGDAAEGTAG